MQAVRGGEPNWKLRPLRSGWNLWSCRDVGRRKHRLHPPVDAHSWGRRRGWGRRHSRSALARDSACKHPKEAVSGPLI